MAESQVNEVKSRTDIVALISNYVSLKKSGRNYKGLCPFHSEKTSSFMVSSERQIFKCFGCSEGGDALTFYQKIEGVEFAEALRDLALKSGVILKEYTPNPKEKQKESFAEIVAKSTEFFHFLLTKHPSGKKALEYLKARGVNNTSINDFQIGFAPDSWDTTFKFLTKHKFTAQDIIAAGLAVPSQKQNPYDRFRNRIVFPIRNSTGKIVGFSGRVFGSGEPKYLNSPDNLLFNKSNNLFGLDLAKSEIKKADNTIIVEGNLDVISSHQIGVKNVVCPLGTAITEPQLQLLRRFSDNITICFDSDRAGFQAAKRALDLAEKSLLNVKFINLSQKDPDELIRANPNLWKKAVSEAVSGYEYIFDKTIQSYDLKEQSSIRKIIRELLPILRQIDNDITRSHYERLLAVKLQVDPESIRSEITKVGDTKVLEKKTLDPYLAEARSLEEYLFALIIQTGYLPKDLSYEEFNNKVLSNLVQLLYKSFEQGKVDSQKFADLVPEETKEIFDKLSLLDIPSEIFENEDRKVLEINTCVTRLKELNLRTRLKQVSLAIKQAEIRKETQTLESLAKEFKTISESLTLVEKKKENSL